MYTYHTHTITMREFHSRHVSLPPTSASDFRHSMKAKGRAHLSLHTKTSITPHHQPAEHHRGTLDTAAVAPELVLNSPPPNGPPPRALHTRRRGTRWPGAAKQNGAAPRPYQQRERAN